MQFWDEEEEKNSAKRAHNGKAEEGLQMEAWDDDINKFKVAYTPEDLLAKMDQFSVALNWTNVRNGDKYLPVLFKEKKCIFETPASICFRGLSQYSNPDSIIRKYSIDFSLRTEGKAEMENLILFLSKMDEFAKAYKPNPNDEFRPSFSVQRRDKSPTLRVKIPNYKRQLNISIILKQTVKETIEIKYPSVEEFVTYIAHDTKVKFQLLVNNIWRAGGKYGLSFKLLKIKVVKENDNIEFR